MAAVTTAVVMLGLGLPAALVAFGHGKAGAATRPVPPPAAVRITDTGFSPVTTTLAVGQSVVFTNTASTPQSVTEAHELFDSGPIPPGGAYAVSIPTAGDYLFASSTSPSSTGQLVVGALGIDAPATDLASADMPTVAVPKADPGDFAVEPTWGLTASRTRMLVQFAPSATVADVNRLLTAVNAVVIGTIPDLGVFDLAIPDTGAFDALMAALATLRADPAVATASLDTMSGAATVPKPNPVLAAGGNALPFTWVANPPMSADPNSADGAWGLERARFPYAWNLLDAIQLSHPSVQTVVYDEGFGPHPDLTGASKLSLCQPSNPSLCNDDIAAEVGHGTGVAGIVGGAYTGGNPLAKIEEVPGGGTFETAPGVAGPAGSSFDGSLELLDEVLANDAPGLALPDLGVINLSVYFHFFDYAMWAKTFTGKSCGPNNLPCTPDNEPTWLKEMANLGAIARTFAEKAAARGVVIVQAANNNSNQFCVPFGQQPCTDAVLSAANDTEFGWAEEHWASSTVTDPILTVSAVGQGLAREPYSNIGDVSGPAQVDTTAAGGGYQTMDGTSAAAPFVTALISLIEAYNPKLTLQQIRELVTSNANVSTTGGAPLMIDAFATLASVPGPDGKSQAAFDLVDANDPTADGNNRVVYKAGGSVNGPDPRVGDPSTPGTRSQPDGAIDMRDFRRYRDAWLEACQNGATADVCTLAGPNITLDGQGSPKKDLNFDSCTGPLPPSCPLAEDVFPRFDAVAAGALDPNATGTVPFDSTGALGSASTLSTLGLIQSLWGKSKPAGATPDTEGYDASQLPGLLVSADLHIHTDDFFQAGATSVAIDVGSKRGSVTVYAPPRTAVPGEPDDETVVTIPVDPAGSPVEASATATINGQTVTSDLGKATLFPGQDVRMDLCSTRVTLLSTPNRLKVGGTASVRATALACDSNTSTAGLPISFTVTPATATDPSQASVSSAPAQTDSTGGATATIAAGSNAGTAHVVATVTFPDGSTATGQLDIPIDPPLRVVYSWQEKVPNFHFAVSGGTGAEAAAVIPLPTQPLPEVITRQGTLNIGGDTQLDEAASGTFGIEWDIVGGGFIDDIYNIDPSSASRTGQILDKVTADETTTQVTVHGLRQVADLPFDYQYLGGIDALPSGTVYPVPANQPYAPDIIFPFLALGLRTNNGLDQNSLRAPSIGDGTAFQFAPSVDADLTLHRAADGSWVPYSYCGSFDPNETFLTPIDGTDQASGHYDIAFTATVQDGPTAPVLTLPDCSNPTPPKAEFSWTPSPTHAGGVTTFHDASTAGKGIASWKWDFGDGTPVSTEPDPTHIYADAASYNVTLTITDGSGQTATISHAVDVKPQPPTATIADQTFDGSSPVVVHAQIFDQDQLAQKGLQVTLKSGTAGWPPAGPLTLPAGPIDITVGTVPAGVYPVTLTVTDYLGQTATATATIVVQAGPVAPPPPPPPVVTDPAPSCSWGVKVDAEYDNLLVSLNAYRAANGLPPVFPSVALTTASLRLANDIATTGNLSSTGSDGSTAASRATDAGFTGTTTDELLLLGPTAAADALVLWQTNTTANAALLSQKSEAIGVGHVASTKGEVWVVDFGTPTDCPGDAPDFQTTLAAFHQASAPVATFTAFHGTAARAATFTAATSPALPTAPFPAVTISNATPAVGAPVTVSDTSRQAGAAAPAVFDAGDGRATVPMPAGTSVTTAWYSSGSPTITMTAGGNAVVLAISVGGTASVPDVAYTGPPSGAQGASIAVTASVTDHATSAALPGRTVTFALGTATTSAVSGGDGVAHALLVIPPGTPLGATSLHVSVAAVGASPGASVDAPFDVTGNLPPIANTGGPYNLLVNDPLVLDATKSTDPDSSAVPFVAWDLGGHGTFSDATGSASSPITIPYSNAQALVCGGTCIPGQAYPIAVRVTDALGASTIASTTVTWTRDFALTITPANQVLNANGVTTYAIDVVSTSGYAQPVNLSVSGVPSGVTATFDMTTVTPNGVAYLTLVAGPTPSTGTTPIMVTGTSGALTHQAGGTLDLQLGLVPTCYGAFDGNVTDRTTGAPIPNATVLDGILPQPTTDANGHFHADNIPLSFNGATPYTIFVTAPGYLTLQLSEIAHCGVVTSFDASLLAAQTGAVAGHVVVGTVPAFPGTNPVVTPTATPIPNANVQYSSPVEQRVGSAGSDGSYSFTGLMLGGDNAAIGGEVFASAPGYWPVFEPVSVSANTTSPLDLALVKACTGTIYSRVLDDTTNQPVSGATVNLVNRLDNHTLGAVSDANGLAVVPNVSLGPNNTPVAYELLAQVPGYLGTSGQANFTLCGDVSIVVLKVHRPIPRAGTIAGTVVDDTTGAPIAGALAGTATTDAQGNFSETWPIGFDAVTQTDATFYTSATGYYTDTRIVTVYDGQTTTLQIRLVPQKSGSVSGTVTDLATGQPLPGMLMLVGGSLVTTDAAGHYAVTGVPLGYLNTPTIIFVQVEDGNGYWGTTTTVTVGPDVPVTLNIQLLHQCTPATVIGTVVNAVTGAPIGGATVGIGGQNVTTDLTGAFTLTGITLYHNQSFTATIYASKYPEFLPAAESITLFCGATITVNFGQASTSTGSITGHVTDARDGSPVVGAFVGSGFGASATTDSSGAYTLTGAPLGAGDSSRSWTVTVIPPTGSPLQSATQTVSVSASAPSTLDFALGLASVPANLSLSPGAGSDTAGTTHTVTATLMRGGLPVVGDVVSFSVTGQNAGATGTCVPANCTTDANGTVRFTYADGQGPGDDTITAQYTDPGGATGSTTATEHWSAAPVDADLSISTIADVHGAGLLPSGAAVQFTPPVGSDEDGPVSVQCDHAPGDTFAIGSTTVTCTASDADDTNSPVSSTFHVVVSDADLSIALVPDVHAVATGPGGAVVSFSAPVAKDEDGAVGVSCDHTSGATFPVGSTTVTCSASDIDDANSPVSTTFQVVVSDADLSISSIADVTAAATGPGGAVVSFSAPVASDEDGAVGVSCDHTSGATFPVGSTTVTCSASDIDDANSPVSTTFNVVVSDSDLSISTIADVQAPGLAPSGASVSFSLPVASDEDGTATVSCDHASGATYPIGTTKVTCRASDAEDLNSPVSTTFNVVVSDSDLSISTIADVHAPGLAPSGASVSFSLPVASDEDGAVAVSCDHLSGATYAVGSTLVTCTASDADDTNSPVSSRFHVIVSLPSETLVETSDLTHGGAPFTTTFTYSDTNGGIDPIAGLTVTGSVCGPAKYASGDANHNGRLDMGETWVFSCTHTFTAVGKYTDIATATGTDTVTGLAAPPVVASQSVVVVQASSPLSAGYWKNHASVMAALLPVSLGGYPVPTTSAAGSVFTAMNCATSSSQNAVGCLAGQLLATELNVANNASDACIYTTMVSAGALLQAIGYTGPTGNYSKLTSAQRSSAVTLATALGNYNTGVATGCG